MKIKFVSLILSIAMLLSFAVSCAKEEEKPKTNEEEKTEYEGLVIDGEYTVVRPDNTDKTVTKSAAYLVDQIKSVAGVDVKLKTDFIKRGDEIPTKEILVGATNRELEFDRTTLKEGEYYVGVEGTRVIIDAYDTETLHFAVREFAKKWLSKDLGIQKDGTLLINDGICKQLLGIDVSVKNSINILSQNMRCNDDGNGNDIDERAPRFKKLVEEYKPDLIGTQETTKKWNDLLRRYFSKEYGMVGCSRNGRNSTSGEWNTLLYRLDRFELLDSDTFWLSNTPGKASKLESSSLNRICTWALLKDKLTGETILMANTHLDHKSEEARNEQSKILLNYLGSKFGKYPMYITGDYNFVPTSQAYKIINNTMLDAHDEALVDKSTTQYTFHSYDKPTKEIDFCFLNNKSTVISYYIVSDDYDGYVSDHYGVLVKVVVD